MVAGILLASRMQDPYVYVPWAISYVLKSYTIFLVFYHVVSTVTGSSRGLIQVSDLEAIANSESPDVWALAMGGFPLNGCNMGLHMAASMNLGCLFGVSL